MSKNNYNIHSTSFTNLMSTEGNEFFRLFNLPDFERLAEIFKSVKDGDKIYARFMIKNEGDFIFQLRETGTSLTKGFVKSKLEDDVTHFCKSNDRCLSDQVTLDECVFTIEATKVRN